MKRYWILWAIALLSFTVNSVYGDDIRPAKDKEEEEFTFEEDPFFDDVELPAKYEGESAVILAQKNYLRLIRKRKEFESIWSSRYKILLQDEAAVQEFSTFYLKGHDRVAFRIIKPNGKILDVDPDDAVELKSGITIPTFFRNSFLYTETEKKLAIRNLEKGDIIEYVMESHATSETINTAPWFVNIFIPTPRFRTVAGRELILRSKYSKVKHLIEIDIPESLYLNVKSYNGAPEFEDKGLLEEGEDLKRYELLVEKMDKRKDEIFSEPNRVNPWFRFKIWDIRGSMIYRSADLNGAQAGIVNSEVSETRVKRACYQYMNRVMSSDDVKDLFLAFQREARYYSGSDVTRFVQTNYTEMHDFICEGKDEDFRVDPYYFVGLFSRACIKEGLKFEVVFGSPRSEGELEDVNAFEDFDMALRIYDERESKWHYVYPFSYYSKYNERNYHLAGQEAYALSYSSKFEECELSKIDVPPYEHHENVYKEKINIKPQEDFSSTHIAFKTRMSGEFRTRHADWALTPFDYDLESSKSNRPSSLERKLDEFKDDIEPILYRHRKERRENIYNSFFEIDKFKLFKVINHGMDEDEEMVVKEAMLVTDLFKKVGNDYYVFELGRVIQNEIHLDPEDFDRKGDVFVNYACTYGYVVDIQLPNGYVMSERDRFEMTIENEAGSFHSSFKELKGGKVRLVIERVFHKAFYEKEDWDLLVEIIEAGDKIANSNIVIEAM